MLIFPHAQCEAIVLCLLWPIQPIRVVLAAAIILRSFYRLIVGGYGRPDLSPWFVGR